MIYLVKRTQWTYIEVDEDANADDTMKTIRCEAHGAQWVVDDDSYHYSAAQLTLHGGYMFIVSYSTPNLTGGHHELIGHYSTLAGAFRKAADLRDSIPGPWTKAETEAPTESWRHDDSGAEVILKRVQVEP